MFSKDELIEMLDDMGIEYELDSEKPGIQYADGRFVSYDELPLPSDFLKRGDPNVYQVGCDTVKEEANN